MKNTNALRILSLAAMQARPVVQHVGHAIVGWLSSLFFSNNSFSYVFIKLMVFCDVLKQQKTKVIITSFTIIFQGVYFFTG